MLHGTMLGTIASFSIGGRLVARAASAFAGNAEFHQVIRCKQCGEEIFCDPGPGTWGLCFECTEEAAALFTRNHGPERAA